MSFVAIHNDTDTIAGWFQFFSGMTLFYSDETEVTLDPQFSLAIPPGSVPMMAFRQIKESWLGPPYSNCTNDAALKYFKDYTLHHCIHECQVDGMLKKCGCVPRNVIPVNKILLIDF